MSDQNFGLVKCCDRNKGDIRYWYGYNMFSVDMEEKDNPDGYAVLENIEYCPWCGIMLDTNLVEGYWK